MLHGWKYIVLPGGEVQSALNSPMDRMMHETIIYPYILRTNSQLITQVFPDDFYHHSPSGHRAQLYQPRDITYLSLTHVTYYSKVHLARAKVRVEYNVISITQIAEYFYGRDDLPADLKGKSFENTRQNSRPCIMIDRRLSLSSMHIDQSREHLQYLFACACDLLPRIGSVREIG